MFVQEDYYLTPDKLWIPLRWIAPELLEEYRGSLIVTDQTKTSNVWYVAAVTNPHEILSNHNGLLVSIY